jgi:TatA/E family protein of Tat protein translocase
MPNIGLPEIIVILVIALIVVGPGRLPDVGAALGKSIREFRKASSDIAEETRLEASPVPPAAAQAPTPQPNVLAPTPASAPQPNVLAPTAPMPTAPTAPAPTAAPPDPADDEPTHLPA